MPTYGPNYPATTLNDPAIGISAWANTGNIGADDTENANSAVTSFEVSTQILVGKNFGFAIPGREILVGLKLEVEHSADTEAGTEDGAHFYKAGVRHTGGVIDDFFDSDWLSATITRLVGDEETIAKAAGLTPTVADINDPGFGFGVIGFTAGGASTIYLVNYLRITAYTTIPVMRNRVTRGQRPTLGSLRR